jgi:GNAT superfamily N-acetyltransferase
MVRFTYYKLETIMPIEETSPEQTADPNIDHLIDERNAWLEQALNPDGSLPSAKVTLLDGNMQRCERTLPQNPPFDGNSGSLYLRIPESEEAVADMVYGQDPSLPGKLIATDVSALPDFRGRGLGKRLYLEGLKALPLGYGLVSHSIHDPKGDGDRMWKWLVECGVARERSEPVQGQIGRYETVF